MEKLLKIILLIPRRIFDMLIRLKNHLKAKDLLGKIRIITLLALAFILIIPLIILGFIIIFACLFLILFFRLFSSPRNGPPSFHR